MRRDLRRHADGDALRAVDDEVREAAGQNGGLGGGLVVVGHEVDGVGVDVGEHLAGDTRHAGFGVTHGGGRVAVDGAEVALAIDEDVAEAEGLGETDEGVVDGRVAVRVEVAHHVADHLRRLGVLLVELKAHLLHAVEDAAMHGLESVAGVGQGAADDDRHGVVEVGAAHLLLDVDGQKLQGSGTGGRTWAVSASAAGGRVVGVGVLRRGGIVGVGAEGELVLIVRHRHANFLSIVTL